MKMKMVVGAMAVTTAVLGIVSPEASMGSTLVGATAGALAGAEAGLGATAGALAGAEVGGGK